MSFSSPLLHHGKVSNSSCMNFHLELRTTTTRRKTQPTHLTINDTRPMTVVSASVLCLWLLRARILVFIRVFLWFYRHLPGFTLDFLAFLPPSKESWLENFTQMNFKETASHLKWNLSLKWGFFVVGFNGSATDWEERRPIEKTTSVVLKLIFHLANLLKLSKNTVFCVFWVLFWLISRNFFNFLEDFPRKNWFSIYSNFLCFCVKTLI